MTMNDGTTVIHVDGASRGNPGPAAFAYVIQIAGGSPVEHAEPMGSKTNNVAEYTALIKALERAQDLSLRRLLIRSDSELMVKQIKGEYRVKNADLKGLYDSAIDLIRGFDDVRMEHVRREQNTRADQLCNIALDGEKPATATKAASGTAKKSAGPKKYVGDGAVREDCLECLRSARSCWERREPVPSVELVWDQLWSVLEEAGVLRKVNG